MIQVLVVESNLCWCITGIFFEVLLHHTLDMFGILASAAITKFQKLVAWTTEIYYLEATRPRSGCQHDWDVVRALLRVYRWLPSYHVFTWQKKSKNKLAGVSSYEYQSHSDSLTFMTPSKPNYFLYSISSTITWRLGLQHINFVGRHNIVAKHQTWLSNNSVHITQFHIIYIIFTYNLLPLPKIFFLVLKKSWQTLCFSSDSY